MKKIKALAREAWAKITKLKNERPGLFWWAICFLIFLVVLVILDISGEWLAAPFAALGSKTVRRARPAADAADEVLERIAAAEKESQDFEETLSEATEDAREASRKVADRAQDSKEPWL